LRKIDLDHIKSVVENAADNHLKDLNFDNKSFKSTMNEFNKEIEKIDKLIRPTFEQITKKLGVNELAVIVNDDFASKEFPPIIAVSWKNKTNDDLKTLQAILALAEIYHTPSQAGDFLIFIPPYIYNKEFAEQIIDYVKNLKPSKNTPIYNALKDAGKDEIKIALHATENFRKELKNEPIGNDIPEQAKNIITFALNKIEWISASISLGRFIENSKNESIRITIKTPKENDAAFLLKMIEGLIDYGVVFAKMNLESQANKPILPPLYFDYYSGIARSLLPELKGDKLVFFRETDAKNKAFEATAIAYAGIGTALLLPAVQAARAAAQRMQGTNDIRQIVLAFHNHHDVYDKFPPLYTVDKNGKPLHSWRVFLLPFLEHDELYKKIKLDEPWDSEYNKQFHNANIPVYSCSYLKNKPVDKKCTFVVVEGQPLTPNRKTGIGDDISDGTSNTIAIIEVTEPFCWMDPKANITLKDIEKGIGQKDSVIGSKTATGVNGVNTVFWDAAAKFLPKDTPINTLKSLSTANGGEITERLP
jgi:hypothetical protein